MNRYRVSAPHWAVTDPGYSVFGERIVRCPDCPWAQALHEEVHADTGPWSLIYWHVDHPDDAVDYLGSLPDRLAVPAYVRWWPQAHWLAIEDRRYEDEPGKLLGTECLEIFQSVSAERGLKRAVRKNAHRRDVFPFTARADIEEAAVGLFRAGLLRPARARLVTGSAGR
ncbi:hypothetical protein GCM10023205_25220 [Yinghuangia aomiensis]|uniref:Uncharacterized protein n=1 Tax=Yinghuangia aomiensis TaxID=676205 RepID=A0ABP9H2V8_9ACTN